MCAIVFNHHRKVRFRVDQARNDQLLEDPNWLDDRRRRPDPQDYSAPSRRYPSDKGYASRHAGDDFLETVL